MDDQERFQAARTLLDEMMVGGYDSRRILVGPDPEEDEIEDRLDVDFLMETRLDSICWCIIDDMGLPEKGRLSWDESMEIISTFMAHVLEKGRTLSEREDGVRYVAVPSPNDDSWVIGQVAVATGDDGKPAFAGVYYHTSLLVLPEFTGRGIGSDLVVEHALHNGRVLNWDLDSCAYSPAGESAHIRALGKIEDLASRLEASPSP